MTAGGPLQEAFRDVMAGVCTPVSVVTAVENGRPYGATVSAFASLSMDPPMVLVSLARQSRLLAVIRRTGRFGLNVLSSGQAALGQRFAAKCTERFHGVQWHLHGGVPRLTGAGGWVSCIVAEVVAGGDHMIVLARVAAAEAMAAPPLTYFARGFGTHQSMQPVGRQ
ncbi:flavin reductase family protein [Salinispora arenicola]|uniref:flavin reductase family protein n=1 Tax=Salinispora arenicola TaxID=168697 RepID=UPI00047F4503|nr:flavin reductase family protein [Salinispora arenicola]